MSIADSLSLGTQEQQQHTAGLDAKALKLQQLARSQELLARDQVDLQRLLAKAAAEPGALVGLMHIYTFFLQVFVCVFLRVKFLVLTIYSITKVSHTYGALKLLQSTPSSGQRLVRRQMSGAPWTHAA